MTAEYGHAPNRVYIDQSGNEHLNGAGFYNASEVNCASALNSLPTKAASVTITPAAGTPSSNVCLVSIQVLDSNGNAIANQETIEVWLSDAATGAGLTATSASGAVAASGTAGIDLKVLTAKKDTLSETSSAGLYILSITDSAKTGFYVTVLRGSSLTVSAQLISANYG